ncbi:MAG: energy-dependent translational throttle protein EttA [Rhodothalassiaceae bacterium]
MSLPQPAAFGTLTNRQERSSMVQYVYHMRGLGKTYPGGRQVLKDITLNFLPGAKIAIIGANGAGKSTLMRIMAGIDTEFTGEAWAADGIRAGYLAQEPVLDPAKDVLGNVMDGVARERAILDRYNEILADYSDEVADEMAELQDKIDAGNLWELDNQVEIAMDALRCPPGDADVSTLSGGERRRVALCRLLLEKPDLLMLDEPTNHLDAESVAWLERYLQDYKGTVILVTHDRYFLDNVVGWVLELDRGQGYPFEGNYSQWLAMKEKRLRIEERAEESRQKALARELDWIRASPKARQAKSKARIKAYDEMLKAQQERLSGPAQIKIQPPTRLGSKVIEFHDVSKAFGDKLLYEHLSFSLPPGGIVGVIGPNGAGKTTLFRLITGEETPDAGEIVIGETVKLGYVDQSRDALDPNKTVWEEISGGDDIFVFGKTEIPTRSYVGAFNFKGSDQQKKVGLLSGGERNRVHLAKMLKGGGNVLLLDEPTNDLDVETLRALEEALEDFAGCAVVISHDRFFLDRLATHILAFEGDSHVEWFEGNFADYEADRKRRLGDAADTPHRIRFKKFERG